MNPTNNKPVLPWKNYEMEVNIQKTWAEYYINDYGNQIKNFVESVFLRLREIKLASELDVSCPLKNGKKPISSSNPRMLGFPIYVVHNFIEKLCNLNFTVVLIDQVTKPPKPKREVVGIYLSSHPLEEYKREIENFTSADLSILDDLNKLKNKDFYLLLSKLFLLNQVQILAT